MSRSKPKSTIRQIEARLDDMTQNINQYIGMLIGELDKHNTLILKMLQRDGLIEEKECPECEGVIRTPLLDGLEDNGNCPYCGHIFDDEQTSLEDYDFSTNGTLSDLAPEEE